MKINGASVTSVYPTSSLSNESFLFNLLQNETRKALLAFHVKYFKLVVEVKTVKMSASKNNINVSYVISDFDENAINDLNLKDDVTNIFKDDSKFSASVLQQDSSVEGDLFCINSTSVV